MNHKIYLEKKEKKVVKAAKNSRTCKIKKSHKTIAQSESETNLFPTNCPFKDIILQ